MASRGITMGLVLVLAASLWTRSPAQSGCTTALVSLAPCISFIVGDSSAPSFSCCAGFASTVSSSPDCVCLLLIGDLAINQTQALALPSACNVQAPLASLCNVTDARTPASVGASLMHMREAEAEAADETFKSSFTACHEGCKANMATASPSARSSATPSAAKKENHGLRTTGTGGSKAVPSTHGNTSEGNTVKAQLHLAVLVVLVASIFKRF